MHALNVDTQHKSRFQNETFLALFDVARKVCETVWNYIHHKLPKRSDPVHLLWALHFFKMYDVGFAISVLWRTDRQTHRKWCWVVLRTIALTRFVSFLN